MLKTSMLGPNTKDVISILSKERRHLMMVEGGFFFFLTSTTVNDKDNNGIELCWL